MIPTSVRHKKFISLVVTALSKELKLKDRTLSIVATVDTPIPSNKIAKMISVFTVEPNEIAISNGEYERVLVGINLDKLGLRASLPEKGGSVDDYLASELLQCISYSSDIDFLFSYYLGDLGGQSVEDYKSGNFDVKKTELFRVYKERYLEVVKNGKVTGTLLDKYFKKYSRNILPMLLIDFDMGVIYYMKGFDASNVDARTKKSWDWFKIDYFMSVLRFTDSTFPKIVKDYVKLELVHPYIYKHNSLGGGGFYDSFIQAS